MKDFLSEAITITRGELILASTIGYLLTRAVLWASHKVVHHA